MLLYACVQHHPNTNNTGRGETGDTDIETVFFHDWSKITQCLKNSQPYLVAIVASNWWPMFNPHRLQKEDSKWEELLCSSLKQQQATQQ